MGGLNVGTRTLSAFILGALLGGCGGDGGGGGPSGSANVSGTVSGGGGPLAGVTVSIGSRQATTDASGAYALTGLAEGAATVNAALQGFQAYQASVSLTAGSNTVDIGMTRQEVFSFTQNSLFAPAAPAQLRGVIVILGGPPTEGFVTGGQIVSDPALEASMQSLGATLRTMAADSGMAMIGTSRIAMEDATASDDIILAALEESATRAHRPELVGAPLIFLALSAGGPEAWGFTSRHTARVAGSGYIHATLRTRVGPPAWLVPSTFWIGELDDVAPPADLLALFGENRAQHALWGAGVNPAATHNTVTGALITSVAEWIRAIVGVRLPATAGGPLRAVTEESGWLGNLDTGAIAAYAAYTDDPLEAAWLPSESAAQAWKVYTGH